MGLLWELRQLDEWYVAITCLRLRALGVNWHTGDVTFVDQANATSEKLAYVTDSGKAIITVDNTTSVVYNYKRDSVRFLEFCDIVTEANSMSRFGSPPKIISALAQSLSWMRPISRTDVRCV